jgi:hypothetical protein
MNELSTLTIVFIVLKLTNVIDWSWWGVFSPTIFEVVVFLFCFSLVELYREYR